MMNTEPMTKVSLLLGTIICLGAFFLIDNNIPVQALHKEEQILEDYDDLADFANAVRNGDEDLEEIPIQSMEAADIYDDADDNMKDCIDLAAKVGDSLTDREVIHCVDDVGYFETKYSSNSTVPANATFATSIDTSETDVEATTDTTSTSDTSDTSTSDTSDTSTSDTSDTSTSDTSDTSTSDTSDTSTSDTSDTSTSDTSDTSTSDTSDTSTSNTSDTSTSDTSDTSTSDTSDTSTSDTSDTSTSDTSDTSTSDTSDTSTSDDVTGNSLINELVNTGKFTEDEAKEFVSENILSDADTTSTSDDNSYSNNTNDTLVTGNDDKIATS